LSLLRLAYLYLHVNKKQSTLIKFSFIIIPKKILDY